MNQMCMFFWAQDLARAITQVRFEPTDRVADAIQAEVESRNHDAAEPVPTPPRIQNAI